MHLNRTNNLIVFPILGVGGHGGIGKNGDSETRFRDILNTISRCIAGNPDSSIPNRNQTLNHLFYPRSSDPRLSLTTITPDLRSDSPNLQQERPTTSTEPDEVTINQFFLQSNILIVHLSHSRWLIIMLWKE